MSIKARLFFSIFSIGTAFCFPTLRTLASDSPVYDNLNRSRQALLEQRDQLQQSADDLARQIDNLNRKLDAVKSYLKNTDAAVREIDRSMSSTH